MNPCKQELYTLKLRAAVEYALLSEMRIEEIIQQLLVTGIVLTSKLYNRFSDDMKRLSDSDWKEWIRNQSEGIMFLHQKQGK